MAGAGIGQVIYLAWRLRSNPLAIALLGAAFAACGGKHELVNTPSIGDSLGPAPADYEGPCRRLCALDPSWAGSTRGAPPFSLTDDAGKKVTLDSLRGKVVVVNLWIAIPEVAPDMPELSKLWKALRARKDVAFVSIAGDGLPDRPRDMLDGKLAEADRYPVLYDTSGKVAQDFGTLQFPETWVLDPAGVLRARFDGTRKWGDLRVLTLVDDLAAGRYCPVEIEDGRVRGQGADYCK
jgi:peroxiredoxin